MRNTFVFRAPDLTPFPATRLHLAMNDGSGDVLWAMLNLPPVPSQKPIVILIHGLTGDEDSASIIASAHYFLTRGHPVVRLNMRGAGPSLPYCRGRYHAGRSGDLAAAIAALPADLTRHGLVLMGVSLGGNVLLKFMAELGADSRVVAAASVCAPIDLKAAQVGIMAARNAIYHRHLLRAMLADLARAKGPPHDLYAANRTRIRSIYDFDDLIVAPANGFMSAEDYYIRCSAGPMLARIRIPTLVVHARTDPWVPEASYLQYDWPAASAVTLLLAPDGGHVGFHAAGDPRPWHDRAIATFFARAAGDSPRA